MEKPKRKRGRPKKYGSRNGQILVRVSEKGANLIQLMAEREGVSRSEILRKAFEDYFKQAF